MKFVEEDHVGCVCRMKGAVSEITSSGAIATVPKGFGKIEPPSPEEVAKTGVDVTPKESHDRRVVQALVERLLKG